MHLKRWIACAIGAIALSSATAATATGYPERPVTVIIHAGPGGGMDIAGRLLFRHIEARTGKTFVVENHPGAGGQVGYTRLITAEPDGYTIGAITTMSIVTHELTREGVMYRVAEDFEPLAQIVLDPSVVVVPADSPIRTLDDLVAEARARDGRMTWGGSFLFGAHHVHYILFSEATGAEMTFIPFDGAADTNAAFLGGHIDVAAGGFANFAALIEDGQARVLAMAGTQRWDAYPDVPTYRELGHDIVIGSNRGFAVQSGTPEDRVAWLREQIEAVVHDEAFIAEAHDLGIGPSLSYLPGPDFADLLIRLRDTVDAVLPPDARVAN